MARLVLGEQPSSAAKSYASSFKEYYEVSTVLAKPDFDFKKRRACWKKFQEMLAKFKVCMETLCFLLFCLDCFSFSITDRERERRKKPLRG